MKVWKYKIDKKAEIALPVGAEVLSADTQDGEVYLWILLDKNAPPSVNRTFIVAMTGQEILEQNLRFIDTVLLSEGTFVLHVFEAL